MFVLFFLCCVLLCGSVLALNLSHQLQASNEAVEKEQSRLLARSGWNLALEQLQLFGASNDIMRTIDDGTLQVKLEASNSAPAAWEIVSTGSYGDYGRTASGIVQCFSLPFIHTADWPVLESLQEQTEAGILIAEDDVYHLQADCMYPLGIASTNSEQIEVEVTDEIIVNNLYIYGDLYVSGVLTADKLYVSGEIYGIEQIRCDAVYGGYASNMPYQIRVLACEAV